MVSTRTMKHRKLYPASETNQTVDCLDICDSTCPFGCYPYEDLDLTPPLPPPLSTNHGKQISPYVIIIVTVLGSIFLLLSYYAIMVRYCSRFRRPPTQSDVPDEEFLDENRGPQIDHPIWYITTVGLQPSAINSITVIKFTKGDRLIEGTDCSVCLNEFQEDETLRLLPKCNHAFHIPCIDTWLRSHTNCPLCRAGILSNTLNPPLASNIQNSHHLGSDENTQMEVELDVNHVREDEICENREETEEGIEFPQVKDETKEIENSERENDPVVENRIQQPVRRSVSMDSTAEITLTGTDFWDIGSEGSSVSWAMAVQKDDSAKPNIRNSRINRKMGGSANGQSLHTGPVLMKRSFSYGERSFLSRHCRSPNARLQR